MAPRKYDRQSRNDDGRERQALDDDGSGGCAQVLMAEIIGGSGDFLNVKKKW